MSDEQPTPTRDPDRTEIQAVVIGDMRRRWDLGRQRYGTGLQIGNGRRMSQDYLEELQDALVYATGIVMQDDELIKIATHLLETVHRQAPGGDACATCVESHPCHTAVDLDRMLGLLGARRGHCGAREPHTPHDHVSVTLGAFRCSGDPTEREPYRSEVRRRGDVSDSKATDQ